MREEDREIERRQKRERMPSPLYGGGVAGDDVMPQVPPHARLPERSEASEATADPRVPLSREQIEERLQRAEAKDMGSIFVPWEKSS